MQKDKIPAVFQPTKAMQNNASRALALLQKHGRSVDDRKELVKIAKAIESGSLLLSDLKDIAGAAVDVFKSQTVERLHADGGPTDCVLNKMLIGGEAGVAFSRLTLNSAGVKVVSKAKLEDTNKEYETGDDIQVVKSLDTELKQALFVVLSPEETDLHGDIYDEDEVRKACHNFNTHCMKANFFHMVETKGASVVESFISLQDMSLNGTFVKKGSWLQNWQFHDDTLWEMVKSGDINGVSIGCVANYVDLNDNEED